MKPLPQSLMFISLVLVAGLIGTAADASRADAGTGDPEEPIARLENTLIEHMKAGGSVGFDERFETLRRVTEEIMAVDLMGRFLFGRDWASFGEQQRERFKRAFLDLSATSYAGRFKEFSGERFDPVEVQKQGEDRAVVKRRLTTGKGDRITFDYLMTRTDSGWQIVTIIIDGVSDLAVKRSQYRRILKGEGFDAVIAHIRDSIESQRSD